MHAFIFVVDAVSDGRCLLASSVRLGVASTLTKVQTLRLAGECQAHIRTKKKKKKTSGRGWRIVLRHSSKRVDAAYRPQDGVPPPPALHSPSLPHPHPVTCGRRGGGREEAERAGGRGCTTQPTKLMAQGEKQSPAPRGKTGNNGKEGTYTHAEEELEEAERVKG